MEFSEVRQKISRRRFNKDAKHPSYFRFPLESGGIPSRIFFLFSGWNSFSWQQMAQNSLHSGFPCSGMSFSLWIQFFFPGVISLSGLDVWNWRHNLQNQIYFFLIRIYFFLIQQEFYLSTQLLSIHELQLCLPVKLMDDDEHKSHSFYQPNIHWVMHILAPEIWKQVLIKQE